MTKLFGESSRYLLFTDGSNAVVIDKSMNMVDNVGDIALLSSAQVWEKEDIKAEKHHYDLAAGALADLKVQVLVASGRMYTIPKSVQEEAKKALEWRKEHDRGGTPVGLNTARTLAAGGQIGIKKVRHIAKYFPRHEVDKKGKGWKPGDDNFPSNGRIAWALWGGDAGWRWARAIVERENKKAVRADGYVIESDGSSFEDYLAASPYDADISIFTIAKTLEGEDKYDFVARTFADGSGIDRLYLIDEMGSARVWDDGEWDDLGNADNDIDAYDKALDDDSDTSETSHILIDPDSALIVSAYLQTSPFKPVSVYDIDSEEAELVLSAMEDMDWSITDAVLTAAGESSDKKKVSDSTPGKYTAAERAKNAKSQVRDKGGKFASQGSRVVVGNDPAKGSGNITKINANTKSVTVKLDSGQTIEVPANQTQKAEDFAPTAIETPGSQTPIDTSGILGQPRAPIDRPNARIPGGLPALTGDQLSQMLSDWPAWVKSQRDAQQATYKQPTMAETGKERAKVAKNIEKKAGIKPFDNLGDLRQHPIYKNLFKKNPKLNLYYDYTPLKADASTKAPVVTKPAKPGVEMTPETSDVQPAYMAIVSPEDPTAVFDLIALVPASSTSTSPMVYKRQDGKWKRDEQILLDLQSPTPPPVVPLDGENLVNTLKQIDGTVTGSAEALIARAGTIGNKVKGHTIGAERLRIYWTVGKGGLKIRWNTPGDWTRCYRNLRKYMGVRAKGYCSLRHKEMTGTWPGSKYNVGKKNKSIRGGANIPSEKEVLDVIYMRAKMADAKSRILVAGGDMKQAGASFTIPLVIPEGIESGDGRKFRKGSIEYRDLPIPLLWQIKTGDGHDGSVVVGRIDKMERTENGIGNAHGVFDTGAYGKEAERMIREGFIRGVSADLDKFEANEETTKEAADDEKDKKIGGGKISINKARVMAVTIVPKPAFQECRIYLDENTDAGESQEEIVNETPDGIYVEEMGDEAMAIVACGMIASSIPTVPPATWFANPNLSGPTPLTVDDHGRVFGHIAAWHVDHIGMSRGTRPPRSKSKYSYFHTGVVRADDDKDYPVGQLTLAGGHASLEASAVEAARHYDDTGSAIADVHAGEDAHGIWVAGALRPSATPEQIRALRASAPSGDWRPINGALELVAVCQVNVPGFPIARARVASGQVYALVAAGAQVLARMKGDPIAELSQRLEALEGKQKEDLSSKIAELSARVKSSVKKEEIASTETVVASSIDTEDLKARIASANAEAELGAISMKARQRLAKEGKALPDGSYPIRNEKDLKNAIQAYGRSKESDRPKVRRHIVKRARGLGKHELIPEEWKSASVVEQDAADLRAQVASAQAVAELASISTETRARLAKEGKALPDGSYPIRNVADLKNAIQAFGRSKESERAEVKKHIKKRARALGKSDLIPENWK